MSGSKMTISLGSKITCVKFQFNYVGNESWLQTQNQPLEHSHQKIWREP